MTWRKDEIFEKEEVPNILLFVAGLEPLFASHFVNEKQFAAWQNVLA